MGLGDRAVAEASASAARSFCFLGRKQRGILRHFGRVGRTTGTAGSLRGGGHRRRRGVLIQLAGLATNRTSRTGERKAEERAFAERERAETVERGNREKRREPAFS